MPPCQPPPPEQKKGVSRIAGLIRDWWWLIPLNSRPYIYCGKPWHVLVGLSDGLPKFCCCNGMFWLQCTSPSESFPMHLHHCPSCPWWSQVSHWQWWCHGRRAFLSKIAISFNFLGADGTGGQALVIPGSSGELLRFRDEFASMKWWTKASVAESMAMMVPAGEKGL